MSKRSFRIGAGIVVVSLLLLVGVGRYLYGVAKSYPTTAHAGNGDSVPVEIDRGMSFPAIASRLAQADVITRPRWFRFYGMYRGDTTKVRPGRYSIANNSTPEQVLDILLKGIKEVTKKVTIPEGLHMLEVFALFEKSGIADAQALEGLGRDSEFLEAHGISGLTIEGYLFPDTYNFKIPTSPKIVLETLVKQHRIVWDRLRRDNEVSAGKVRTAQGWSDHQFLTMASIVEKEAVSAAERPRIAQVFMNRLTSPKFVPHKLETDPTIRYGCTVPRRKSPGCQAWKITDRLRRKQLDDAENLYNTYQHEGLPPGPICSPGADALKAVMKPDGSKYFFFVAKDSKHHVFAKTLAEHERNVDKYIRNK